MNTVTFRNSGLIDLEAVKTLGVSVKEGPTPIGYFGTGLKFALATILRGGGEVTLFRGRDAHTFGTVEKDIRGTRFLVVTMDGVELGFTVNMGRDWQPWMAYRELACNALDEGGDVHLGRILPGPDETHFVVTWPAIVEAHRDRREFLIERDEAPLYGDHKAQMFPINGDGDWIFYRGVRVSNQRMKTLFRYNVLNDVELTEDRTAKYGFQLQDPIAEMYLRCGDRGLLREVLLADQDTVEHNLDWLTCGTSPGETWLDVVAELGRQGARLHSRVERAYERARHQSPTLPSTGMPLRPEQQQAMSRAIALLERAGYNVAQFPIMVTDRLGPGVLGRASGGTIYIATDALRMGDATLAGTLLEEWLHLSRGFKDCERPMQNWLFDALVEQIIRADYLEEVQRAAA